MFNSHNLNSSSKNLRKTTRKEQTKEKKCHFHFPSSLRVFAEIRAKKKKKKNMRARNPYQLEEEETQELV